MDDDFNTPIKFITNDDAIITTNWGLVKRFVIFKEAPTSKMWLEAQPDPVYLPEINKYCLEKMIAWLEHHRNDPPEYGEEDETRKRTTEIDEWDQKFLQLDQDSLFNLVLACNYVDLKGLFDLCCKTVANMIKGKSPEDIRKIFNITDTDFKEGQEEEIRRQNEWAEDR